MSLPAKCVVDTNVPKVANLAIQPDSESDIPISCVEACLSAVEHVVETRGLILDAGDEIFSEYMGQLSISGQPGIGDRFMKWVHDNRWSLNASERVTITRNGDSYDQFPSCSGLENFDPSDRKFVAVSNAHPEKPLILQATDSKWWGWKGALAKCGINVEFLCREYVEALKQDGHVNEKFVKFPSTPHLATLPGVEIRNDKVLTAQERREILTRELTVEEKVDGANLGISFDSSGNLLAQNRGSYLNLPSSGQWRTLLDWLRLRTDALFDTLSDQFILFGEWCYAKHSVCYSRLADWFIGLDIYYRRSDRFLSAPRRDALCRKIGVAQVPIIARGCFEFEELANLLGKSALTDQPAEGIYVRSDSGKWLVQRAKLVCPVFFRSLNEHWTQFALEPNRLLGDLNDTRLEDTRQ